MLDEFFEKKERNEDVFEKKSYEWIKLFFLLYGLNYVIGLRYIYIYYDNQYVLMKKFENLKSLIKNCRKQKLFCFIDKRIGDSLLCKDIEM